MSDIAKMQRICSFKGTTVGGAMSLTGGWNVACVTTYGGVGIVVITLDAIAGFVTAGSFQLYMQCGVASIQPTHVLTSPSVITATMATAVAGVATESTFWGCVYRNLSRASATP